MSPVWLDGDFARGTRRYWGVLFARGSLLLVTAYAVGIGGTYNGLLLVPLLRFSLVLLTIGVAGWLIVVWRRPLALSDLPFAPAMMVWAAACGISALFHLSGRVAIGLWYAGFYAGVWLVFSDVVRRGLPGRWMTDAVLFASVPVLVLALAQVAAWFPAWLAVRELDVAFVPPRPPGTLGNPNTLGALLALLLPPGIVRLRYAPRRADRGLWALWLAGALVTLFLTYSRGAWLAAGVGMAALAGLMWRAQVTKRARRVVMTGGLLVGLLAIVLAVITLGVFDSPRRETGSRLVFFRVAGQSFADHPLTGTGPTTFGLSLLENRSIPPDQPHAHAHNLILNVAAELGLLGLLALGVTGVMVARRLRRALHDAIDPAARAAVAACGAALAAAAAHGMVDMPVMVPAIMLLVLSILAAHLVPAAPPTGPANRAGRAVYRVTVLGIWVALLGTGWWSASVYAGYVRGEERLVEGDYRRGAALLKEAADAQPSLALYHAEYAYACGLAASAGDETYLQPALDAYRRALDLEAPHAVWWANLAALHGQAGQDDQAVTAMQQALDYAPDDPDLWLNLGIMLEAQGRSELAGDTYRRVLALDSEWGRSRFWSETPLRAAAVAAYPVAPSPFQRIEALWQAGDRAGAMSEFELWVDRDPSQAKPYAQMARLFIDAGHLDRARGYLDAAYVLVHNEVGRAWIHVAESELARAQGDLAGASAHLQQARDVLWPDETGHPLVYGRDVAYYQFLRVRVRGALLPQLTVLGPDPLLTDLLR